MRSFAIVLGCLRRIQFESDGSRIVDSRIGATWCQTQEVKQSYFSADD
jgi:hypothetical protein